MKTIFRQANLTDCQAIYDLVFSRVHWMDEVGLKQWNVTHYDTRYPFSYFQKNISSFYVLFQDGVLVATAALYEKDVRWPGYSNDAFYIHHLSSNLNYPGRGKLFLLEVEKYAKQVGKAYLRLDSAVDNAKLESFYDDLGYVEKGYCQDGLYQGILREKSLN